MTDQIIQKVPPQSIEAEMAVLGAMLLDESAVPRGLDILKPNHFYVERHSQIFRIIAGLYNKKRPVDLLTIRDSLKKHKQLEAVGGSVYLSSLVNSVATAANLEYYAGIVKECASKRTIISTAMGMIDLAYQNEIEATEIIIQAQKGFTEVSTFEEELKPIGDHVDAGFERISQMLTADKRIVGLTSGINGLDAATRGFMPGDLIVLAAYTSRGKSCLAMSFALHIGGILKKPVAFFSYEMSPVTLAARAICSDAQVNQRDTTEGYFKNVFNKLITATDTLRNNRVHLCNASRKPIENLRLLCLNMKNKKGLDFIVVDYLQLVPGPEKQIKDRVSENCHRLKDLAAELNVPVLVLSQFTRPETKYGKNGQPLPLPEPQIYHLKESGTIENDAALIMIIHGNKILIKKQREGCRDVEVGIKFEPKYTRFEDADEVYDKPRKDTGNE